MRDLWNLFRHGRVAGNVGWCGQYGYWWVKPCPHYYDAEGDGRMGCHWLDIGRLREVAVLEFIQQTRYADHEETR